MSRGVSWIAGALLLVCIASPALAQSFVKIPEPTDMALFGLAIAGLVVGRRSSRVPPHDDNDA